MAWTPPVNLATGDKVTDAIWNLQVIDNLLYLKARAIDFVCVQDQKASGTAGGAFNNAAWRTRDINTEVIDTASVCSIAGNQITLAAGQYVCFVSAPAYRVDQNQTRLQNITAGTTLLWGTTAHNPNANATQVNSFIYGGFTLAVASVLEIQHQCTTTVAANGFGVNTSFAGNVEVYTIAYFLKYG